jgi:alcohol dehydrogenase (cytochrome c)
LFAVIEPSERINAQDLPKEEIYASYTRAQAAQGKAAYKQTCAQCHGQNVDDGEFGTPLKGLDFAEGWAGKSAGALFIFMKTNMPPANPGGLQDKTYAQIIAYLLQENSLQPGESELPPDVKSLGPMILLRGSAMPAGTLSPALSPFGERPRAVSIANPLNNIRPVTDEMLLHPRPEEWLTWRRTYDALGFSPLKQINRGNVADLHVAWAFSLPSGPNEETPLVHDAVLFVEGFGDKVQAIDAVTGDLLWQYARQLPENVNKEPKRNLAIYGERLLVPTSDAHLVALDVKTGEVIWDREMANYDQGARITGGPLVVKGKVLQGTSGRGLGGQLHRGPRYRDGQRNLAIQYYCWARPVGRG